MTLDTIAKTYNVGRINFIKIDVDGFEGKVIRGARQTLKAYRPVLFFEISPSLMANNGDDANELIDTLLKLGFVLKRTPRNWSLTPTPSWRRSESVLGQRAGYTADILRPALG